MLSDRFQRRLVDLSRFRIAGTRRDGELHEIPRLTELPTPR
jgi:hypothetical protein